MFHDIITVNEDAAAADSEYQLLISTQLSLRWLSGVYARTPLAFAKAYRSDALLYLPSTSPRHVTYSQPYAGTLYFWYFR